MPDGRLQRTRAAYQSCRMCLMSDCECLCETCHAARVRRMARAAAKLPRLSDARVAEIMRSLGRVH